MTLPPIPTLPGPDWTYAQARDVEAAIRAHMADHGPSPETMAALARVLAGRCAYRPAVAVMDEALAGWMGFGHATLGLNGWLQALGAALHGGLHTEAERHVAVVAAHRDGIEASFAHAVVRYVRGTGLQPALRDILERCAACIDPTTPEAELTGSLLREYEDASAIAAKVRLVSLGSGCYPWLQSNRYMLRHVDQVDTLMPFNLAATVEAGLCTALESGLAAFFDAGEFDLTTMTRGIPLGRITRYGMLLCHDTDEEFLADDMAELRAACAARARTFLDHAVSGPRVLFRLDGTFSDLHRLEAAVAGAMHDDDYRLLLVTTQHGDLPELPAPRLKTTRLIHLPAPRAGYNWTMADGTPEGYRYDLAMRRIVLDVMRELA